MLTTLQRTLRTFDNALFHDVYVNGWISFALGTGMKRVPRITLYN